MTVEMVPSLGLANWHRERYTGKQKLINQDRSSNG